jgi:hypothetical protein
MATETVSFKELFQAQYVEFADQLEETFPELEPFIKTALELSDEDRIEAFAKEVLPTMASVQGKKEDPTYLLPGVKLPSGIWKTLSENNKKSILSYLGLLCSCSLFTVNNDISGSAANPNGEGWKGAMKWYESMLNQWKEKANGVDWSSMTSKISSVFGISGDGFKLPEKFLKGHLARLVEELMVDFKPEDFGFSEEDIKGLEGSAGGSNAFELLMKVYTQNPDVMQKIIEKVGNRLKSKIMSGSINPKQIAIEAEELMKEFTENPEFKTLLESIKTMFGFEDPDFARAAGREGSARVAAARDRLRKKLEKKKNSTSVPQANIVTANEMNQKSLSEIINEINAVGIDKKNKKK